jgi:hypothetical protein
MSIVKLQTVAPKFLLDEILSSPADDCILCLFNSQEVTIIREALFPIAYWRTRLGENIGANLFRYTEDKSTIKWFRELVDGIDYKLSGDEMTTCFSDVADGLRAIAQSLNCLCSGGVGNCPQGQITEGGESIPNDPNFGTGEGEGQGEPPDGYDSWEEYYQVKCNQAAFIARAVPALISACSTQYALLTAVTLAVLITSIATLDLPEFTIGAILALLLFCGAEALGDLAQGLNDRFDEIKCALYLSKTVGEAIDQITPIIDGIIQGLVVILPIGKTLKLLMVLLFSEMATQRLFSFVGAFMPTEDCSECGVLACQLVNKDLSWPTVITKINEDQYSVVFGYVPTHWGNSFGLDDLTRTLESIQLTLGSYNADYASFFICEDGVISELDLYPPNLAAQINALMPISGFVSFWLGYQAEALECVVNLSGDCVGCSGGDINEKIREYLLQHQNSPVFGKIPQLGKL